MEHFRDFGVDLENLKMKPALISRFDLLFILIDRPDEYKDAMLSDHIMNMHNGVKSVSSIGKIYLLFKNRTSLLPTLPFFC